MLLERQVEFDVVSEASEVVSDYWEEREQLDVESQVEQSFKEIKTSDHRDFLLEGTGFDLKGQMDVFAKEVAKAKSGEIGFDQAKANVEVKIREDVVGFYGEYLERFPALPIYVDKGIIDGQERLVCTRYSDAKWLDIISEKEREGAAKQGFEKLEKELLGLPPGSMAIVTSPKGWSGFTASGHPVSQTYCFSVCDDNSIEALTIRSSMSLEENEQLVRNEGSGTTKERIKDVVENVRVIENCDFKDISKQIQNIMKKRHVLVDPDTGQKYGFRKLRRAIKNRKDLSIVDAQVEGILARFSKYYDENVDIENLSNEMISEMTIEIGRMVLDMSIAMGYAKGKISNETRYKDIRNDEEKKQYKQARSSTAELGGCAGGGGFNSRKYKEGEKVECVRCGKCKRVVTVTYKNGYLICGSCKAKKKV